MRWLLACCPVIFGVTIATHGQLESGQACRTHRVNQWQRHFEARYQTGTPEHRNRMARYDIHCYHIRITLDTLSTNITGHTTIYAHLVDTLDTFSFELHPALTIDSIVLNDNTYLTVITNGSERDLPLVTSLSPSETLRVDVFYHGTAQEGLFNKQSPTWGNRVTYTLTEPDEADGWFPCKQELDDKADSVIIDATVPVGCRIGANGVLESISTHAGLHTYHWKTRYPIAYYLISVSVARYTDYTFTAYLSDSIHLPVVNYVYPKALGYFQAQIDTTGALLRLFSNRFGRYPFWKEKYGHCMAPFSGGMEHQTMTTQGYFSLSLTAHELAHQWFGNHVTCATWNDLWLNEGFASYAEIITREAFSGAIAARRQMNRWHDDIMAAPGGSVYITDEEVSDVGRLFNYRLTYQKGAAVVHMLRYLMGDSTFFAALKAYQQVFAFGTITTDSFQHFMETFSGLDLDSFFRQWVYGEGYPIYTLQWSQVEDTLYIQVNQQTSHPSVPRFDISLPIRYADGSGVHDTRIMPTGTTAVKVNGTVSQLIVDPDHWIPEQHVITHTPWMGIGQPPAPNLPIPHVITTPHGWTIATSHSWYLRIIDPFGRVIQEHAIPPGTTFIPQPSRPCFPCLFEFRSPDGGRYAMPIR